MPFRPWLALLFAGLVCSFPSVVKAQGVEAVFADAAVATLACRAQEVQTPSAWGAAGEDSATIRIGRSRVIASVNVSRGYVASCLRSVYTRALDAMTGDVQPRTVILSAEAPSAISSRGLRWLLAELEPKLAVCSRTDTSIALERQRDQVRMSVRPESARSCVRNHIGPLLARLSAVARGQRGDASARIRLSARQGDLVDPFRPHATSRAQRGAARRGTPAGDEVLLPDGWGGPYQRVPPGMARPSTMRVAPRRAPSRRRPASHMVRTRMRNEVLDPFGP